MAAIGVGIVLTRETLQVRWRAWIVEHLVDRWLVAPALLSPQRHRQGAAQPRVPHLRRHALGHRAAGRPRHRPAAGRGRRGGLHLHPVERRRLLHARSGLAGTFTIPAYMVIVALAYGFIASGLMLWVGAPLVGFVGRKNEAEGYFRFAMMRIRDNAESVALMNGARYEQAVLGRFYETVVARWMAIVWQHGHLTWITNASGPMIPIVPLLFAAPKYISGELTLGQVTQLAAAFIQVQIAISWVVDNYNRVAEWYASARRVMDIVDACDAIDPHIDAIAPTPTRAAGRAGRQRALGRFRDRRRQRPAPAVGRRSLGRSRRGRAHPRRFQHRQVDAGARAGGPVVGRARQPRAARPVAGDDHAAEELPAARLAQGRAALSQPLAAGARRRARGGARQGRPRARSGPGSTRWRAGTRCCPTASASVWPSPG